ncbi:MAG: acyltransferase family protein, partial [Massilia sp.]
MIIRHSNNFNLLRFIFATMVIVAHAPQLFDNNHERDLLFRLGHSMDLGQLAVDLFFILSGFLIVKSWQSNPSITSFLSKRIRRIYPGFVAASLFCAFIVGPIAASNSADYFANFSFGKFALGTALLQKPVTPPVFPGTELQLNGSMWTIAPEFTCYLAVLGLGLLGFVRDRRLWACCTALVVTMFAIQRFELAVWLPDYWLRFAGCFMSGGVIFLFREKIPRSDGLAMFAALAIVACQFSWRLSELVVMVAAPFLIIHLGQKHWQPIAGFNKMPDVSY